MKRKIGLSKYQQKCIHYSQEGLPFTCNAMLEIYCIYTQKYSKRFSFLYYIVNGVDSVPVSDEDKAPEPPNEILQKETEEEEGKIDADPQEGDVLRVYRPYLYGKRADPMFNDFKQDGYGYGGNPHTKIAPGYGKRQDPMTNDLKENGYGKRQVMTNDLKENGYGKRQVMTNDLKENGYGERQVMTNDLKENGYGKRQVMTNDLKENGYGNKRQKPMTYPIQENGYGNKRQEPMTNDIKENGYGNKRKDPQVGIVNGMNK